MESEWNQTKFDQNVSEIFVYLKFFYLIFHESIEFVKF